MSERAARSQVSTRATVPEPTVGGPRFVGGLPARSVGIAGHVWPINRFFPEEPRSLGSSGRELVFITRANGWPLSDAAVHSGPKTHALGGTERLIQSGSHAKVRRRTLMQPLRCLW